MHHYPGTEAEAGSRAMSTPGGHRGPAIPWYRTKAGEAAIASVIALATGGSGFAVWVSAELNRLHDLTHHVQIVQQDDKAKIDTNTAAVQDAKTTADTANKKATQAKAAATGANDASTKSAAKADAASTKADAATMAAKKKPPPKIVVHNVTTAPEPVASPSPAPAPLGLPALLPPKGK